MTTKEKADKLIDKMYYVGRYDDKEDYNPAMAWERAKQCALVAVDEILNTIEYSSQADELSKTTYWQEVKQEICDL